MSNILVSKLPEYCVYLDSSGRKIEKSELVEQVGEGWIAFLLSIPVSNTIVESFAVLTDCAIGFGPGDEGAAFETLNTYLWEHCDTELNSDNLIIERII